MAAVGDWGKDIAVFVEAARGGIREWSGLDYPAYFYASCGISLWEVHNKLAEKLLNDTPLRRGFIVYAHFAFIPEKGDNYLDSLDN